MRYSACILSQDPVFSQFLYLTILPKLHNTATFTSTAHLPDADIYVVDLDTVSMPKELTGKVLCCSAVHDKPQDFPYLWLDRPFRPARLLAILDLSDAVTDFDLFLIEDRHSVLLAGREITLTEKEYALLRALLDAHGNYVTRDELLEKVWSPGETDPGIVNVYIHYLRSKLRRGGQRFIESARGRGYALRTGDLEE